MRLTIIPSDNAVLINGKMWELDCSSISSDVHAVQWYDDHGEIEFEDVDGVGASNEVIGDISQFQSLIDAWNTINDAPPEPTLITITQITRRQMILMLVQLGLITSEEALAAATNGTMPAIVSDFVSALPLEQRVPAEITWASMSVCMRDDPMLTALAVSSGLTEEQTDGYFNMAAAL